MRFQCPHCQAVLQSDEVSEGMEIECPSCNRTFGNMEFEDEPNPAGGFTFETTETRNEELEKDGNESSFVRPDRNGSFREKNKKRFSAAGSGIAREYRRKKIAFLRWCRNGAFCEKSKKCLYAARTGIVRACLRAKKSFLLRSERMRRSVSCFAGFRSTRFRRLSLVAGSAIVLFCALAATVRWFGSSGAIARRIEQALVYDLETTERFMADGEPDAKHQRSGQVFLKRSGNRKRYCSAMKTYLYAADVPDDFKSLFLDHVEAHSKLAHMEEKVAWAMSESGGEVGKNTASVVKQAMMNLAEADHAVDETFDLVNRCALRFGAKVPNIANAASGKSGQKKDAVSDPAVSTFGKTVEQKAASPQTVQKVVAGQKNAEADTISSSEDKQKNAAIGLLALMTLAAAAQENHQKQARENERREHEYYRQQGDAFVAALLEENARRAQEQQRKTERNKYYRACPWCGGKGRLGSMGELGGYDPTVICQKCGGTGAVQGP